MANVACILVMTPCAMDGHNMGIVKGVNLSMSFTFTSGSQREGPQKGRASWFVLRPIRKNTLESRKTHGFQMIDDG